MRRLWPVLLASSVLACIHDDLPASSSSISSSREPLTPGNSFALRIVTNTKALEFSVEPMALELLRTVVIPESTAQLARHLRVSQQADRIFFGARPCYFEWGSGECASVGQSYCGPVAVPSEYYLQSTVCPTGDEDCHVIGGDGLAADVVLFFSAVESEWCQEGVVTYGQHCAQDGNSSRPTFGYINFCPAALQKLSSSVESVSRFTRYVVHESAHILGISRHLYAHWRPNGSPSAVLQTTKRNGRTVAHITSPSVRRSVREHFGCSNAVGAEVEGGGLSHWEARLFRTELMTAETIDVQGVLSELTLAALNDSGWYEVDASSAQPLLWGRDSGCAALDQSCLDGTPSAPVASMYCGWGDEGGCSPTRRAMGPCRIKRYTQPLPSAFQYFKSWPEYGGISALADYCPIVQEERMCDSPINATHGSVCLAGDQGARCGSVQCVSGVMHVATGQHWLVCNGSSEATAAGCPSEREAMALCMDMSFRAAETERFAQRLSVTASATATTTTTPPTTATRPSATIEANTTSTANEEGAPATTVAMTMSTQTGAGGAGEETTAEEGPGVTWASLNVELNKLQSDDESEGSDNPTSIGAPFIGTLVAGSIVTFGLGACCVRSVLTSAGKKTLSVEDDDDDNEDAEVKLGNVKLDNMHVDGQVQAADAQHAASCTPPPASAITRQPTPQQATYLSFLPPYIVDLVDNLSTYIGAAALSPPIAHPVASADANPPRPRLSLWHPTAGRRPFKPREAPRPAAPTRCAMVLSSVESSPALSSPSPKVAASHGPRMTPTTSLHTGMAPDTAGPTPLPRTVTPSAANHEDMAVAAVSPGSPVPVCRLFGSDRVRRRWSSATAGDDGMDSEVTSAPAATQWSPPCDMFADSVPLSPASEENGQTGGHGRRRTPSTLMAALISPFVEKKSTPLIVPKSC